MCWSKLCTVLGSVLAKTIRTKVSRSSRLCSCHSPTVCPISWIAFPVLQPPDSEICCLPPWRPTCDQQPSPAKNSTKSVSVVRGTNRIAVFACQCAIASAMRCWSGVPSAIVKGTRPPGQRNRSPEMITPAATSPGAERLAAVRCSTSSVRPRQISPSTIDQPPMSAYCTGRLVKPTPSIRPVRTSVELSCSPPYDRSPPSSDCLLRGAIPIPRSPCPPGGRRPPRRCERRAERTDTRRGRRCPIEQRQPCAARTPSESAGQASFAHRSNSVSVSTTSASRATGSTQTKVPLRPKCPYVPGALRAPVQCGDLESRISTPNPQSLLGCRPNPGTTPVRPGNCTCPSSATVLGCSTVPGVSSSPATAARSATLARPPQAAGPGSVVAVSPSGSQSACRR